MNTKLKVKVGDEIYINSNRAIISRIHTKENTIEVVYKRRDSTNMYDDAHFIDGAWRFASDGPHGAYADGAPSG